MKVIELIEKLKEMPPLCPVLFIYDGEPRGIPGNVYLSKDSRVMLADFDENVYSDNARPVDAPTKTEMPYWKTPSDPEDCELPD